MSVKVPTEIRMEVQHQNLIIYFYYRVFFTVIVSNSDDSRRGDLPRIKDLDH